MEGGRREGGREEEDEIKPVMSILILLSVSRLMVWPRQPCLAGSQASQASQDTEITSANITVLRLTLTAPSLPPPVRARKKAARSAAG